MLYKEKEHEILKIIKCEFGDLEDKKVEEYESLKEENEPLKKFEQLKNNSVQEWYLNTKEKIKTGRPMKYRTDIVRRTQELKFEGKTYGKIFSIFGFNIGHISFKLKFLWIV